LRKAFYHEVTKNTEEKQGRRVSPLSFKAMKPVCESVYTVSGLGFGRVYVVEAGNSLTLVDAGWREDTARRLERQLARIGRSLADVRHILITHAHPDHANGLPELQRLTPARTYAHRREALVLRGERPVQYARPETLRGIQKLLAGLPLPASVPVAKVDVEVKEGDALDDALPGLRVVETFGHSIGHTSYWWEARGLLFAGDAVMHMPWGVRKPVAFVNFDHAETRRSLAKIAALDADILCPGHGTPVIREPQSKL